MSVSVITSRETSPEWDAFAGAHPAATLFHRGAWLGLVREVYGGEAYYLAAHQDGQVRGILPLMLRRVTGWGRVLISVPYADVGGVCGAAGEVRKALIHQASELGRELGARFVELRQREPLELDLPCNRSRVTVVKALPGEVEELWNGVRGKNRNQIRKAQKCGLTTSDGHEDKLGAFYGVYARNTRDLGSPMHSAHFFEALLRAFPQHTHVVLVHSEGHAIGGAVAVADDHTFAVPWAASLRSHFSLCPNHALYWRLLEMAVEHRCTSFDFGRSAPGSGTYQFKRQWGAEDVPLHYEYLRLASCPDLGEKRDSAAYRAFSALWQHTPMPIARKVGPWVFSRLGI